MNWPIYENYVASDVEWVGSIPAHWSVKPLFTIGSEGGASNAGLTEKNLLSLSYGRIIDKNINSVDGLLPASFETYQIVQPGDIIFRFTDLQNDKRSLRSGLVSRRGIITSAYLAFTPEFIDSEYFSHLMRSYDLVKVFYARGGGLRQSLKFDDVKRIPIVVPPLGEQQMIASFLDRETAKIDALISTQEKLIGTLREDRIATITNAVTKGLDPDVEFEDSDSNEIPSSPTHWTRRTQLKRMATVQTGLTLGKVVDPNDSVSMPYLRVANVQSRGVNLDEVKTVQVSKSEVSKYLLRDGDVLMTEGGDIDKLGRGCLWSGEVSPCIHQNHVFATRCHSDLNSSFLVYLLDTSVARNYFFMTAKKTTNLASTNSTTLGRFSFSLPPRTEQEKIVEFLDQQTAKIDGLIATASDLITTLREYRAALITAAVTGKIDVRGVA